jgi:hypothetical protein
VSFGTVFEPLGLWQRVARELESPQRAAGRLALIALLGAFGPACAVYAGTHLVNLLTDGDLGFLPLAEGRIDPFRATFVGLLIAPALLAVVYLLLGRVYKLPLRPLAAFAVAVVGALPIYLAGLTMVFMPAILLVVCAFVLSCFWWAVGLRTVFGVSPRDSAEFNAISILGLIVLMQLAGALLSDLVA